MEAVAVNVLALSFQNLHHFPTDLYYHPAYHSYRSNPLLSLLKSSALLQFID
jgi:hypothetical protein